jgi:hypothetical protein
MSWHLYLSKDGLFQLPGFLRREVGESRALLGSHELGKTHARLG